MEKKLIKILMLLVATVSVGAFVSCKDTNVDLYNEYRAQAIQDNASLQETLEKQIENLEKQIATYEAALANIKQCDCNKEALNATIDGLKTQIGTNNTLILALSSDKADKAVVDALIGGLNNQIGDINEALNPIVQNFTSIADKVNAHEAAIPLLEQAINQLKLDLAAIKSCNCEADINDLKIRVAKLETDMQNAESLAQQAMSLATTANTNAINATNTANTANTTATEAKGIAQQAKDDATAATNAATAATNAAAEAVRIASLAQNTVDGYRDIVNEAKENAATALQTAIDANRLASDLQTIATTASETANSNKTEIELIKQNAQTLASLINTNTQNIATNTQDISDMKADIAALTEKTNKIEENAAKIQENANAINGIQIQLAGISSDLQNTLTRANEAYAYAQANDTRIDSLASVVAGLMASFNDTKQDVQDLKSNVQTLSEKVGDNTNEIGNLKTRLDDLKETVQATDNTVSKLTDKLDSLCNEVTVLKTELAQVKLDCADNLEKAKAYTREAIALAWVDIMKEFSIDRQKLARDSTDIDWLKRRLTELNTAIDKCVTRDEMQAWFDRIIKLETDLPTAVQQLTDKINTDISNLRTEINDGLGDKIKLVLIENKYVTEEQVTELVQPLIDAAVGAAGEDYKTRMDIIGDSVKTNFENLVLVTERVTALENSTVKTEDYTVDKQELWDKINEQGLSIGELQDKVETITSDIEDMKNDISDLQTRMDAAEGRLDAVESALETLQADVAAIQSALAKQVTSIVVQGTYNPLFGSITIPGSNAMSTALVAFYGQPVKAVEFPTSKTSNYVRKAEALTAKDMEMISGVQVFRAPANLPLLNEDGNAGKVYMTINPNTADLTGLQLSLVNSLDEESPIKLSPIKKSSTKLKSGWTRASNNNGFYEADAYVTNQIVMNEDNGLGFDRDDITTIYNDFYQQTTQLANNFNTPGKQTDLARLATDVYQIIRNIGLDRTGLKCTYTTTEADGSTKEHSVYSEYNMAASFLKPLHLAWGKDFNYYTMHGYEAVDDLLNNIASTLKGHTTVLFRDASISNKIKELTNSLKIDEIELLNVSEDLVAHFNARVSSFTLNGVGYYLTIPAAGGFDIMFDKNLKASGNAVTIPAAIAYDSQLVNINRSTLVIYGDINTGLKTKIIVPAKGGDGAIGAYASLELDEASVKASLVGNTIKVTSNGETNNVATYASNAISVTSGCVSALVLRNLTGTQGGLNLPFVTEVTNDLLDLLERQKITLEDLTNDINATLDEVNNYEGVVHGWIDSFIDEYLRKYLDQINQNVISFFNAINRRFGPFLVASNNGKGFKRLGFSKDYPAVLKAEGLALYPTTKTMELIVPLARKHVAVTNVFKDGKSAQVDETYDLVSKLQTVNNSNDKLNTVLDGTVRWIPVSGMVPGYVYEIAYSVLDFDGNISTMKGYITVE